MFNLRIRSLQNWPTHCKIKYSICATRTHPAPHTLKDGCNKMSSLQEFIPMKKCNLQYFWLDRVHLRCTLQHSLILRCTLQHSPWYCGAISSTLLDTAVHSPALSLILWCTLQHSPWYCCALSSTLLDTAVHSPAQKTKISTNTYAKILLFGITYFDQTFSQFFGRYFRENFRANENCCENENFCENFRENANFRKTKFREISRKLPHFRMIFAKMKKTVCVSTLHSPALSLILWCTLLDTSVHSPALSLIPRCTLQHSPWYCSALSLIPRCTLQHSPWYWGALSLILRCTLLDTVYWYIF
jgi:hypothetical protein